MANTTKASTKKKPTAKTTKASAKKKPTTRKKVRRSSKTLLVVESPSKAKTINKYLGSNYIVEASVGHIKDLIKVRLGVDVENDFQPKYTTIKGKADVIKRLKALAEKTSKVLIATDPDREGEAIAWHIAQEVKEKNENVKRALFNEITKSGIKHGVEEPCEIDVNLFMSQQARRVMDRLIGYQVSPFLSRALIETTTKPLSAGRVQSVALRLLCEREDLIRSFEPIEYWSLLGDFMTEDNKPLAARLVAFDGKIIKNPEGSANAPTENEKSEIQKKIDSLNFIRNKEQANELTERIKLRDYYIQKITKKKVTRKPAPPFTTSLLQQEASRRHGFSNKKTMLIAQKLYEGAKLGEEGQVGLITYMRTDSFRLSPDAQNAARDYIEKKFGPDYMPKNPFQYKSKKSNIQDAHEAIRPTSVEYSPEVIRRYLSRDEAILYELIFNRFLASQMSPAVIDQTTVEIEGGEFKFRAAGSVVTFPGFLKVYGDVKENNHKNEKDKNGALPEGLKENVGADLKNIAQNQSFTKPKPRFTEASLVKELDELGVGRPSTYAQIVSTIIDREYVVLEKKSFSPTELGEEVNKVLVKNFPDLFNVDFTAEMETKLDTVAEGAESYVNMLKGFYTPFRKSLEYAEEHGDIPEIPCPVCSAPMVIRVSRKGRFFGCSRYPECTGTKPLPKNNKDSEKEQPQIVEGIKCDLCGGDMLVRQGRFGRFYGCANYPKCKGIKQIKSGVKCPECGKGELIERFSPKSKKKFWGCSNYPDCKNLSNYEPIDRNCPKCGHYYLEYRFRKLEDGYKKYIRCPECKESFEIENEK